MSKSSIAKYQRLNGSRVLPSKNRTRRGGGFPFGGLLSYLLVLALLLVAVVGTYLYFTPATRLKQDKAYVFVAPGSNYEQLYSQLQRRLGLRYPKIFAYVASFKGLDKAELRSGRFEVTRSMNMLQLIDALQQGAPVPVRLTPAGQRTQQEIISYLCSGLYLKADTLKVAMQDSSLMARYESSPETIHAQVLREAYDLPWDISAVALLDSIHSHYKRFWNESRQQQAATIGLSPLQVITLASIVESESAHQEEYARIAGLYLNRLRKSMRLQSDPTVKYALGDFDLKRIKAEHLAVSSPYNTYLVKGLPPAPIVLPHQATIDSVLHAEPHSYLYMCAKEDFSGTHNFAASFAEHLRNARLYQQALNAKNIH